MEIGLPVPEKILKGFYHTWAWRPSWSCDQHHHQIFISLYLKAFIKKLVQIGKEVSEKIAFEFLYIHDIGDRQYSHTFIYSIRCQLLLTFRSVAAIVSEKSTVFTFSYRKAKVTKFDLAVK